MVYQQFGGFNKTMRFDNIATEVKNLLLEEIENHKSGNGKDGNVIQLNSFINDIDRMIGATSSNVFTPAFPHVIVDSWRMDSKLGEQLLNLFELYKKVK